MGLWEESCMMSSEGGGGVLGHWRCTSRMMGSMRKGGGGEGDAGMDRGMVGWMDV
jgi:hypothetical protein